MDHNTIVAAVVATLAAPGGRPPLLLPPLPPAPPPSPPHGPPAPPSGPHGASQTSS